MDEATPTISPRRIGDVLPEGFEFERLGSRLRAVVISSLLVASLAIVGWNAIDPVAENRPLTDSGVFFAIGLHIQEGRTLYSEVWDHKPPLVYWLNATAIEILGPSFSSVRTAERVIAIVALVSTFCALSITFQSRAIGFAGAIAYASFLYENPRIFEQGNLTEEYGAAFILVALAAASLARRFTRPALGLTSAAASGAALALAIFSKEPFLMSAIALISWMAWPIDETVLAAARRALASIAGMAIATLGTVLFLARAENLDEWIDVVEYNFANSAASGASSTLAERFVEGVARVDELVLHGSWFAWLLLAAGALSAFWPEFARKSRGLPAFGAAGLLLAFAGASISARGYGHYYMQLVPFVVVLLASTAGLLLHVAERWLRDMGRQIHALLAMAVLLIPGFLEPISNSPQLDLRRPHPASRAEDLVYSTTWFT